MTLTSKQPQSPIIEPMLPLINVVFLLLIFFMLAGHIAAPINGLSIPVVQQKNPLAAQQSAQENWLFVSQDGELRYQKHVIACSALATIFADKAHISLLADGAITTGQLEKITRELREIGVKKITLITQFALPAKANS